MDEPVGAEVMAQLPEELRRMLQADQIRTLDDVTDVTAIFTRLVAEQELPTRLSKEVRLWTELMFSAVAAKNVTPQNEINVIGQLIQAVSVGDAAPKQIDEVIDLEVMVEAESRPKVRARPKKKVVNGR